ncbi:MULTISPECIES: TRAP transporter small permease subunit [Rhodomicrobium]|uniref:TRAP transporter small permease subunit n=1 Tax=Rhodomicrobium TaxID=1068 RepID=UPI000B4B7127|nr:MULTISPECIES: TRAP transporter small permease subunit [Rhodomicrobium]
MAIVVRAALRFGAQLLPLATAIDRVSKFGGVIASSLVLIACLISAGNAFSRYAIHANSNAWLEVQWYMFAGMVLLGAAETLRRNEHVRVDLVYGSVSHRAREWIDLLGGVVFLMPMCLIMIYFTWPVFLDSWNQSEMSSNAGGLIRWPVKLMLPVGFALLALQGLAEIIKRGAALRGLRVDEIAYQTPLQ